MIDQWSVWVFVRTGWRLNKWNHNFPPGLHSVQHNKHSFQEVTTQTFNVLYALRISVVRWNPHAPSSTSSIYLPWADGIFAAEEKPTRYTFVDPTSGFVSLRKWDITIYTYTQCSLLAHKFDYFSVSSRYIEQQYRQLLDIHEILCVEEVVQNIRQDEHPFPRFHDARDTASMLAKKANEGLTYIEKHCRESGIKIDLRTIRSQHRLSFENIHPYTILLPYIRSQNQSNDEDDTYSTQT